MSERTAMITLLIEMQFVQLDGKGIEEGRDWPSARYICWVASVLRRNKAIPFVTVFHAA